MCCGIGLTTRSLGSNRSVSYFTRQKSYRTNLYPEAGRISAKSSSVSSCTEDDRLTPRLAASHQDRTCTVSAIPVAHVKRTAGAAMSCLASAACCAFELNAWTTNVSPSYFVDAAVSCVLFSTYFIPSDGGKQTGSNCIAFQQFELNLT